jgi:hypothetical protein
MQRLILVGCALLLAVSAGRAQPVGDLIQERLKLLDQLTDALQKKDESAVKPLAKKLEENQRKLKEAMDQARRQVEQAEERAQKALEASGLKIDLSAAGITSAADVLTNKTIKLLYDMADAFEKKDLAKTAELYKKAEELQKKFKDLKLTAAQEDRLKEKYKPEMDRALKRLEEARNKAISKDELGGDEKKKDNGKKDERKND